MGKIYTVTKLEHNKKGPGKTGTYDGSFLSTMSENGAKRIDFIFKSREAGDQGSVVADLAVGDKVDLTIVKNGDFYNLSREKDAIKFVEVGEPSKVSTTPTIKTHTGGWKEDPEKQAAIIRQNALTNATNFVVAMLTKDMFKKTATPDFFICEITRVAKEFVKFTSGELAFEELTAGTKSIAPFSEQGDNEFPE